MHFTNIFIFLALCLICANARVLNCQKKIARRIKKIPPSSLAESTYGCLGSCGYNGPCGCTGPCGRSGQCSYNGPCGYNDPCSTGPCVRPGQCGCSGPCGCPGQCGCTGPCSCRNIFLDELSGYNMNYGNLNPVTPYDRVPAIKLPKTYSSIDVGPIPIPAINLPSLCQCDVPGQRHNLPYQLLEAPCNYLKSFDVNNPVIKMPIDSIQYIEGPNYQTISVCGCQTDCGCNRKCGCQLLSELELPCGCQQAAYDVLSQVTSLLCGCPTGLDCGCQLLPSCQLPAIRQLPGPSVPFAYQLPALEIPYAYQMPALEVPCGCQSSGSGCQPSSCGYQSPGCGCQTSGRGCQSIQPPVVGCGKYLRQITLQPPFL